MNSSFVPMYACPCGCVYMSVLDVFTFRNSKICRTLFGYYAVVMRSGGWYYKDRLGRSRGPMELVNLKTAWAAGIVDRNTFIWGDDMDEWAPIHMVYGLEQCVDTPDSKLCLVM